MNDTTWFWQIVDARGLADVSSDEFVALNELVSKAERLGESERNLSEAREEIERLKKLSDRYGVALMMIRAGCSDPARFAGNILDDRQPVNVELDEEDFDENHR